MIKLYKKISEDKIECLLCPHFCVLNKDEIGKCHARHSDGEKISHIKLGAISSLAVESIEKKPFKKFLPGTKTLTVGGFFCNLHCEFCENHSISQNGSSINSQILTSSELVNKAIEKDCQSISMSYNEPTISYEFLIQLAKECRVKDLKFLLKTNAYINKDPWKIICRKTDAINIDWKGSEEKFKLITGSNDYVLRDRIKEAYDAGAHFEISIPLYYKDDELENEIKIVGEFLSSINKDIPCHLLRISPSFLYDEFIFDTENMKKAKNILSQYMNNIYEVI